MMMAVQSDRVLNTHGAPPPVTLGRPRPAAAHEVGLDSDWLSSHEAYSKLNLNDADIQKAYPALFDTAINRGDLVEIRRTWDMAKDGKFRFAPIRQREVSKRIAIRRARQMPERKALQARLLAKWRSK